MNEWSHSVVSDMGKESERESLCCALEANTILSINYTSIFKNNLKVASIDADVIITFLN